MSATDKNMPMNTALTIAAVIGVVAFLLLKIVGGFGFFGALFLGLLVGIAAFVVLMIWFVGEAGGTPVSREGAAPKAPSASVAASASGATPRDATQPGSGAGAAAPAPNPGAAEASSVEAKPKPKPAKPEPAKPAKPSKAADAKPAKSATSAAKPVEAAAGAKPAALSSARAEGADNLKEIKGIGPKMEVMLNEMGFYHFDQVAGWSAEEVSWVDQNLKGFKGRVSRDGWVEQAKILASGSDTEFSKKVDKGGVY